MEYWARINGKDYPIAFDWTLDEEFSESLDSASIMIPHARGLNSLKPYDDVIIHDYDPNSDEPLPDRPYGQEFKPSNGHFYRHMLVASRNIDELNLDPIDGKRYYNYQISLWSETKGLETVQLPNRTISQPIDTGVDGYKPSSVSFLWGNDNINLPIRLVGKWSDGIWIYKSWDLLNQSYRLVSLFAGDMDSQTINYSAFSTMESNVKSGDIFALPDWNISNVSMVCGDILYFFGFETDQLIEKIISVKPRKHWIIRKIGINDSEWQTRETSLNRIKEFLLASAIADQNHQRVYGFDEIVNFDAYRENGQAKNDISSDESVATIRVSLMLQNNVQLENYVCYLYVDPVYADDVGIIDRPIPNNPNIFGMTSSTNGIIAPTHDSEFLAYWDFSCSRNNEYVAKDVLTVAEAVRQAVEMYSPYIKVTSNGNNWQYRRKYSIDPQTITEFENVIAPENQWNNPNLRDYITRLFYVADCIPIVRDNVIKYMKLSERLPKPFYVADNNRSFANSTMDGGSYCDRLLREYDDGLSKDNVTTCAERIGFKNMNSPTLTLENMELELSHPIYRINKVYMCYYAKMYKNGIPYMRLTKQDITPLVILNEQRNLLSENWNELENLNNIPSSIKDLAKFKYATIGYSIGDTKLSGWGTKYNHPTALFWKTTRSVIENIFEWLDNNNPTGVTDMLEDFSGIEMQDGADSTFNSNASDNRNGVMEQDGEYVENEQTVISYDDVEESSVIGKFLGTFTQRLKTMVFEIEYQGYVSSSVIASKDYHDGNVVSRDNASSSLSFVESDGINQKEKANRLGNENISVSARYKSFGDIQNLAQVWNETDDDGNKIHDDEVLFKRSIRFSEGYFTASYYLCKNYVLRNYFTSVFSKHRPFPLASYEQSVQRKENRTLEILLSSKEWLYQGESKKVSLSMDDIGKLFSFFVPSIYDTAGNVINENGVDSSYYVVYPSHTFSYAGQTGIFACDSQKFVSGNSLCFVVSMNDSVSAGTYVSNFNNNVGAYVLDVIKSTLSVAVGEYSTSNDVLQSTHILTGCRQDWFMFPVDPKTGFMYGMSFGVGLCQGNAYATKGASEYSAYDIASSQLFPLMDVVLEKAELTSLSNHTRIYFGKRKDSYLVGCGYPHIALVSDSENEGKFKVDLSRATESFVYDDCIVSGNSITGFGTYDGQPLPQRNTIKEFISSKFYGHETPNDIEEADNCVFKDGKERMTVTLQLEPVTAEDAIQFSPYMMKLSDVMGGSKKNYTNSTMSNSVRFKYGVSRISTKCRNVSTGSGGAPANFVNLILFTIPTMTIGIPSTFTNVDFPSGGIVVEKTWTSEPNSSEGYTDSYSITVKKITSILENGTLTAECVIRYGGLQPQVVEVPFYNPTKFDNVVFGRTTDIATAKDGNHERWGFSFSADSVLLKTGDGFIDYVMCEDVFMGEGNSVCFRYDTLLRNRRPTSLLTASGQLAKAGEYAVLDMPPFPYNECALDWKNSNFRSFTYSYSVSPMDNTDVTSLSTAIGPYNNFIMENGPTIATTGSMPRNMFWVLSSSPVDKTSPYEALNEEPANAYSASEFVPNENIRVDRVGSLVRGLAKIVITLPERIEGDEGASLRLYYKENERFHFVFGVNLGVPNEEGTKRSNYLYPVDEDALVYEVYLSFVDDRSKTVIDARTGDPSYKVLNFLDADSNVQRNPSNICVEK